MAGMTEPHVDPLFIPLVKENHDGKSDKDFVKIKLRRNPMSPTSDLYEFKMSLFDNGEPEEFLLFVRNFNMNLAAAGTLEAGVKYQYLRTIVCGEALYQFDSLSDDVEVTETLNVDYMFRSLSQYCTPLNMKPKQKCAMLRETKRMRSLTVRHYVTCLIDINEYLKSFTGATLTVKIGVTKLNEILINSMPNRWYKHAYLQGFDCESITIKKAVNMFERMEIAEFIYGGVVEPSYKKPTRADTNRTVHSRQNRGEAAS